MEFSCTSTSGDVEQLQKFIQNAVNFLNFYRDIVDAYVSNFFTKDHWKSLNPQWRKAISAMDTEGISDLLTNSLQHQRQVLPLSLLSFRACTQIYSLSRTPVKTDNINFKKLSKAHGKTAYNETLPLDKRSSPSLDGQVLKCSSLPVELESSDPERSKDNICDGQYRPLNSCYRKHVKPKKQHEILQLGKLINTVCQTCEGKHVVDVGAGQGHLSRLLSFGHNLKVTTVEASGCHAPKAQKFDMDMSYTIRSHLKRKLNENQKTGSVIESAVSKENETPLPSHVTCMIQPDTSPEEFLQVINRTTQTNGSITDKSDISKTYGLVLTGLHACGDLSPTILRVFARCPEIHSVVSVGCCYMKMTTQDSNVSRRDVGYPMSDYVSSLCNSELSYEAREMACHSADVYRQRLIDNPPNLKLHCYRAMLQEIILHIQPEFQVGSRKLTIKKAEQMDFRRYMEKALAKLELDCNIDDDYLKTVEDKLSAWKDVVGFYTIRLSVAPVVETVILLDRMLYLHEQGISSSLIPVFDPALSPRNFALVAIK